MTDEEQVRLLICMECKTIQPLADFRGHPDDDVELAAAVRPHREQQHLGTLMSVPEKHWGVTAERQQIIDRINEQLQGGETGLGSGTYAMVDNFKEDAFACFEAHLRNAACPDYMSDTKRLIPDTAAERRELGLVAAKDYDREGGQKTIYLCQYCPVHSMVQQAMRKKAGMYDK